MHSATRPQKCTYSFVCLLLLMQLLILYQLRSPLPPQPQYEHIQTNCTEYSCASSKIEPSLPVNTNTNPLLEPSINYQTPDTIPSISYTSSSPIGVPSVSPFVPSPTLSLLSFFESSSSSSIEPSRPTSSTLDDSESKPTLAYPNTQWTPERWWVPNVTWMNQRIESFRPEFKDATIHNGLFARCAMTQEQQLEWNTVLNKSLEHLPLCRKKNIAVVLGLVFWVGFTGQSGTPVGELLQWTDLIHALIILGHNVTILDDKHTFYQAVTTLEQYDFVFCDYHFPRYYLNDTTVWTETLKPKIRVLDTFGTQDFFNQLSLSEAESYNVEYCCLKIHPSQFYTFYPHTPENTFLGYAVMSAKYHLHASSTFTNSSVVYSKKNQTLVWGKEASFWAGSQKYLSQVYKAGFEVHGTVVWNYELRNVPQFVEKHEILKPEELGQMLEETKLFLGLGFPYDGPSPFEAMARGAKYINPRFTTLRNRNNTQHFYGKPTFRSYTSQHPYLETFPQAVRTIDIHNTTEVEEMLQWASNLKEEEFVPFIPEDFQVGNFVERVFRLVQFHMIENRNGIFVQIDPNKVALGV